MSESPRLLWFLAELTYACPLRCAYCSNPLAFAQQQRELSTTQWLDLFKQARALGATQLGFSGGEPLLRRDLEELVAYARQLGFYTNLITSGLGLGADRLAKLKAAGLDNIQISFQAGRQELNDQLAGVKAFAAKEAAVEAIKSAGFALGLNFVLHRHNIDETEAILEFAIGMQADYVELANAQYYGFALLNRRYLLPTAAQLARSSEVARRYQERYKSQTRIIYVVPDYFEGRPKACMNGWAKNFMLVTPEGQALPCHAAAAIKALSFPRVTEEDLATIWHESVAFNAYRGTSWLKDPCRSCPERERDFGGCRCQAYLLSGDAAAADPACRLSPHHHLIEDAVSAPPDEAVLTALVPRTPRNSLRFSAQS